VIINDLLGRDVLDLSTATTAGRVDDAVVDPQQRTVRGLVVGKAPGPGTWLSWSDIKSIGPDAVTIDRPDLITAAPNDLGPGCRGGGVLGGRVLTDRGRELGPLSTIDVDPESGAVKAIVLADRQLPADQLVGIGSYATVVRDPDPA
jgi:sporulation protein YlmC with PRC-barrel domain